MTFHWDIDLAKVYTKAKIPVLPAHIPTIEDISKQSHPGDIDLLEIDTEIGLLIENDVMLQLVTEEDLMQQLETKG